MLITNITMKGGPVLKGTSKATNNVNLTKIHQIKELKTDGFGGYWLLFQASMPGQGPAHKWFRVTMSNIDECQGVDERIHIQGILDRVAQMIQCRPEADKIPEMSQVQKTFEVEAGDVAHLVHQQIGRTKAAAKLLAPLDKARSALAKWLEEAEMAGLVEEEMPDDEYQPPTAPVEEKPQPAAE